jgi:formylglycine-generating enzyme required for sulfatase activity
MMGASPSDLVEDYEQPSRSIAVQPFAVSRTAVSCGEWRSFLKETGYEWDMWDKVAGRSPTEEHPIVFVSWTDARRFCEWESSRSGQHVRLPTEAEWEFLCRFLFAADSPDWSFEDWCETFGDRHPPVTFSKCSHPSGICGIWEGVAEWCFDWFHEDAYSSDLPLEAVRLRISNFKSWRGGSPLVAGYRRCTFRGFDIPTAQTPVIGFRPVIGSPIADSSAAG